MGLPVDDDELGGGGGSWLDLREIDRARQVRSTLLFSSSLQRRLNGRWLFVIALLSSVSARQ